MLLVFGVELYGTSREPLFESGFVFQIYLVCKASLLVAACLSLFLHFGNTAVDSLEVAYLKLRVDYLFVSDRVYRAIDVSNIIIVETTKYMDNSVCLAYIRQKFVAKPFALACSFDQSRYIDYLYRRGYDALRVADFGKFVETFVGHGDDSYVRFDGTKSEVCSLCLSVRQTIEQSRFADIRQSYDSTL